MTTVERPAARPASAWRPTGLVVLLGSVAALLATHLTGTVDAGPYRVAGLCIGAVGVLLGLTGAYRLRHRVGAAGWLIAAALVSSFVADIGWSVNTAILHVEPFPSWTDGFYLANYALLVAAVMVLLRRRGGRNAAALIDAATVSIGVGVLAYVFVIADALYTPGGSVVTRLVGALYPLFDVFFVGMVTRLLLGAARHRGPLAVMAGAMTVQLVADVVWTVNVFTELSSEMSRLVDSSYLLVYVLLGWTLWQRDAEHLVTGDVDAGRALGPRRMVMLGSAGLLAPITLLLREWSGGDLHVTAVAVGAMILFALALVRMALLVTEVQDQSRLLAVQARTDALTGLANRRTFDFELERAMHDADGPVSVGILDLDRFKRFNDENGHAEGDRLLRECAAHWSDELARVAPRGVLARYGGEEFVVVLRGDREDAAARVVEALLLRTPGGQTFSAGVAEWDGSEPTLTLLRRADERLYAAKAAGRARVVGQPAGGTAVVPAGGVPTGS